MFWEGGEPAAARDEQSHERTNAGEETSVRCENHTKRGNALTRLEGAAGDGAAWAASVGGPCGTVVEGTHGQIELRRMPSRACTIASSRVIASTAPCEERGASEGRVGRLEAARDVPSTRYLHARSSALRRFPTPNGQARSGGGGTGGGRREKRKGKARRRGIRGEGGTGTHMRAGASRRP